MKIATVTLIAPTYSSATTTAPPPAELDLAFRAELELYFPRERELSWAAIGMGDLPTFLIAAALDDEITKHEFYYDDGAGNNIGQGGMTAKGGYKWVPIGTTGHEVVRDLFATSSLENAVPAPFELTNQTHKIGTEEHVYSAKVQARYRILEVTSL